MHGPNRLLTETLPLGGARAATGGARGADLAVRGGHHRAGHPGPAPTGAGAGESGWLVPVAVYVLAYAVTSSAPGRDRVGGVLLLITLVAIGLGRHLHDQASPVSARSNSASDAYPDDPDGRPSPWRPAAAGAIVGAVTAVVLAVAVPNLPGMSRKPASLNRPAHRRDRTDHRPGGRHGGARDDNPVAHRARTPS